MNSKYPTQNISNYQNAEQHTSMGGVGVFVHSERARRRLYRSETCEPDSPPVPEKGRWKGRVRGRNRTRQSRGASGMRYLVLLLLLAIPFLLAAAVVVPEIFMRS